MTRRPLSILLVCRSFPAHRAGGMEQHAQDVLDGLMRAGHTVHVATTRLPTRPALRSLEPNGELLAFAGDGEGHYDARFLLELPRRCRELCRAQPVDIVHAQGFAGVPLAIARLGVPLVTTIHGTLLSETPLDPRIRRHRSPAQRLRDVWRFKHRLAFWPIWRGFLALRPHLIVDSEFTRRELLREARRLDPVVVPLGIDLDRYLREGAREAFDPEAQALRPHAEVAARPLLLFAVGRLEPIKGFDILLRALAKARIAKPWHLVLAGAGPDRVRLERIAAHPALRGRVTFAGRIAHEQLVRWLAAADLVINPDQGQPAFGLTNAEALVLGAPVLASRNGAHRELLTPEDGWLVSNQNPARSATVALAKGDKRRATIAAPADIVSSPAAISAWPHALERATVRLPEPDTTRARRAARARHRFARERMIERLEAAYRRLLDPHDD